MFTTYSRFIHSNTDTININRLENVFGIEKIKNFLSKINFLKPFTFNLLKTTKSMLLCDS